MEVGSEQRKQTMEYIVKGIKFICDTCKERLPGSASERKAQAYFADELKKWTDTTISEDFDLHPLGFMGFIPFAAVFGIFASILFFIQRWFDAPALVVVAMLLALLCALMFIFEFLLYREFIDFVFPKKRSCNVYAVRKSSEEPIRRIVFGGHADAANEWTYSFRGGMPALATAIGGSVFGLFFILISDLVYIIMGFPAIQGAWNIIAYIQLVLIAAFIMIAFFINWKIVVDGANDNLSACYVSMAVVREMAENDFRFKNTEVGVIITGSEEAGLRGALAFGKKHREEMSEIETIFIPLETLRETSQLAIYELDQTGTVRNDKRVSALLRKAGLDIGLDLHVAELYPGSTDAAGFTRTGLISCGLGGVNHNPQKYYHTRMDRADNISEDCMERTLEICHAAAKIFDEVGLSNK